ncbi:MAG: hypothetical protein ACM31C_19600 [Acidobacteriota bacterium]
MNWIDVARLGKFMPPTEADEAAAALAKRPNNLRARAEPVLADMAATSPDAAGIKSAIARLDGALPSFYDPKLAVGGGDQPDVGTVKQCGFVLYHGLLARAGAAVKALPKPDDAAVALVEATRSIDGYRPTLKQSLVDEVMGGLGYELFARASATLDAQKKP